MDNTFIEGYDEIVNYYGYWPSFHDDLINKIKITSSKIEFYIIQQSFSEELNNNSKIKLTFSEVKDFNLEGELLGCLSIILDIEFQMINGIIETQVSSSLGARGTIHSNKVKFEFE